jgi:hypothetical protein
MAQREHSLARHITVWSATVHVQIISPCLAWEEEATLKGRTTIPYWMIGPFTEGCTGVWC